MYLKQNSYLLLFSLLGLAEKFELLLWLPLYFYWRNIFKQHDTCSGLVWASSPRPSSHRYMYPHSCKGRDGPEVLRGFWPLSQHPNAVPCFHTQWQNSNLNLHLHVIIRAFLSRWKHYLSGFQQFASMIIT